MICPECNGRGETIYCVEVDRDENTVTMMQRKGICRTCNGSGKKTQTNADRIRAMSDEELAVFLVSVENRRRGNGCGAVWHLPDIALEWLKQPAEEVHADG